MDNHDETHSQLWRRLPLGTRVRHLEDREGTVVGYGATIPMVVIDDDRGNTTYYCYAWNVKRVEEWNAQKQLRS